MKTIVPVNATALKAAIVAVVGEEAHEVIKQAYETLDRYEDAVREDCAADEITDSAEFGADCYFDGLEEGMQKGYAQAMQAFYSDKQPDVIYLPDQTPPGDDRVLALAAAALEGGPSEL